MEKCRKYRSGGDASLYGPSYPPRGCSRPIGHDGLCREYDGNAFIPDSEAPGPLEYNEDDAGEPR